MIPRNFFRTRRTSCRGVRPRKLTTNSIDASPAGHALSLGEEARVVDVPTIRPYAGLPAEALVPQLVDEGSYLAPTMFRLLRQYVGSRRWC